MGLFLCDVCNEQLGPAPHVCDLAKVREYVDRLEDQARVAERRLEDVRNAVYKILQPLDGLEKREEGDVLVSGEWLRKLWAAAQCNWDLMAEARTADSFLTCWIATHRVLRKAFDVFRTGKGLTLQEKLQALREACNQASEVLGYQSSKLDMSVEDVIQNRRD